MHTYTNVCMCLHMYISHTYAVTNSALEDRKNVRQNYNDSSERQASARTDILILTVTVTVTVTVNMTVIMTLSSLQSRITNEFSSILFIHVHNILSTIKVIIPRDT